MPRLTFAPRFARFLAQRHPSCSLGATYQHATSTQTRGVLSAGQLVFYCMQKHSLFCLIPFPSVCTGSLGVPNSSKQRREWLLRGLLEAAGRAVPPGLLRNLEHIFIFHFTLSPLRSQEFSTWPLPSPPVNCFPGELRTPLSAIKPADNGLISSVTLHGCFRKSHKPVGYAKRGVTMLSLHQLLLRPAAPALLSGGAAQQ